MAGYEFSPTYVFPYKEDSYKEDGQRKRLPSIYYAVETCVLNL